RCAQCLPCTGADSPPSRRSWPICSDRKRRRHSRRGPHRVERGCCGRTRHHYGTVRAQQVGVESGHEQGPYLRSVVACAGRPAGGGIHSDPARAPDQALCGCFTGARFQRGVEMSLDTARTSACATVEAHNRRKGSIAMSTSARYGVLFCFSLVSAWAQVSTGTVVGVVEDSSGAIVPGAEVTLKNTATGETRQTRTNDRGEFNDPFVRVGEYTVNVSASGFKAKLLSGITLRVDQTVN